MRCWQFCRYYVKQLPSEISLSYSGLSYEEIQTQDQAPALYVMTILFVFLSLAALYESWSVPFSVALVVPFGILGGCYRDTVTRFILRCLFPNRFDDHHWPISEKCHLNC